MSGASVKSLMKLINLRGLEDLKPHTIYEHWATSVEKSTVKSGSFKFSHKLATTDANETKFCSIDDPECEACQ